MQSTTKLSANRIDHIKKDIAQSMQTIYSLMVQAAGTPTTGLPTFFVVLATSEKCCLYMNNNIYISIFYTLHTIKYTNDVMIFLKTAIHNLG